MEFVDNTLPEKKEEKAQLNVSSSTTNMTPPVTPNENLEKEQTSKPKSYRDAIGKSEKPTSANNETPAATAAAAPTGGKSKKANKQQQKTGKANASATTNNRSTRGHPQDANDYYDDSWYYGQSEEGYLSTGYTDDQEVFVGHLSAQVTENEVNHLDILFNAIELPL